MRSHPSFVLYAALIATMCAGCAASVDLGHTLSEYRAKRICCASPAEFDFRSVTGPGRVNLTITQDSPAFSFGDSGKSYFIAFELSPGTKALVLKSTLMPGNPVISNESIFFYPIVTFFDSQKMPIASTTLEQLAYHRPEFLKDYLELSEPVPSNAKFFAVHTSENLVEGRAGFSLNYEFSLNGIPRAGARPLHASPISPSNVLELEIQ